MRLELHRLSLSFRLRKILYLHDFFRVFYSSNVFSFIFHLQSTIASWRIKLVLGLRTKLSWFFLKSWKIICSDDKKTIKLKKKWLEMVKRNCLVWIGHRVQLELAIEWFNFQKKKTKNVNHRHVIDATETIVFIWACPQNNKKKLATIKRNE